MLRMDTIRLVAVGTRVNLPRPTLGARTGTITQIGGCGYGKCQHGTNCASVQIVTTAGVTTTLNFDIATLTPTTRAAN